LALRTLSILPALVGLLVTELPAQAPVPAEAKAAMEPLAWMAGRWSGEGTHQSPAGPRVVLQSEEVRTALEGALLVVEGTGREPGPDGAPGAVVFRAFGVLSSGDAGEYRFAAWQGGRFVDAWAKLDDDGSMTWGFDTPDGGSVRYTIRRPEPDVWHETGAFRAAAGGEWRPFFEMTLHRESTGGR